MIDMGHDVLLRRSDRGIQAYANHDRVASRARFIQSEHFEELQIRYVLFAFGAGTDRGYDGQDCEGRAAKLTGACSVSHRRSAVGTFHRRWKFWKSRM